MAASDYRVRRKTGRFRFEVFQRPASHRLIPDGENRDTLTRRRWFSFSGAKQGVQMKFNEDGSGFTLENEDEWNRFKKMAMIAIRSKSKQQSTAQPVFDTLKDDEVKVKVDIDDYFANHDFAMLHEIIDGLTNAHRARAQVVFDALKDHEVQVYSDDPSDSTSMPASKWGEKLDEAITKNLDTSSIFEFVEILMEDKERTMQTVRAHKRHAENRTMKTEVFQWLDENMTAFKSMDAAAQGIAGKTTPITFRTARDWVGEWKKLRSTGTP